MRPPKVDSLDSLTLDFVRHTDSEYATCSEVLQRVQDVRDDQIERLGQFQRDVSLSIKTAKPETIERVLIDILSTCSIPNHLLTQNGLTIVGGHLKSKG